jgi:hypothetical protein
MNIPEGEDNSKVILLLFLALTGSAFGLDSKACAPCHAAIYKRYINSAMAQSSGVVEPSHLKETFEHASFRSPDGSAQYTVTRRAGGVFVDFRQGELEGTRRLDYYLGSGLIGRSYLSSVDGFLFQAPVAYYTGPERWDLSPGYEHAQEVNLIRSVDFACLNCHASGVEATAGTKNGYAKPPFRENGVSCERCHGSGQEHVDRVKAGKVMGGLAIVNPAKLAVEKRDSVCAQCHLRGAVRITKLGERTYRPGEVLSDSTAVFVWSERGRLVPANSHFEQLAQSRCWRASQGKVWCGTCHDPHGAKVDVEQRCSGCHACGKKFQNNCVTCHMPRTPAITVQHAAFTDHSIPRIVLSRKSLSADAILSPFGGSTSTDRDLGLAYATLALEDNNRAWGMRAVGLLESASDVKAVGQLAQFYDRMGKEDVACAMYRRVVDSDPAATGAAVNLGTCLAKQGKMEDSIRIWKSALTRDPGLESARFNLAVALYRLGKADDARATLDEGLKFNPASKRARELLQAIR